ncbi:MAG TPA: hypothetical protein VFO85_21350 [Vicinamibacteria bacterium]|nr:hypothetical protein [Vicinamibacteria bacterium]
MTGAQLLLAWAVKAALVATLAGLVVRRRLHLCLAFVIYALVVLGCETAIALWPERFYTADFWMVKQALYDATKVAIALELAYRVVRAFPGAMRTARISALALLAGSTAIIVAGPWGAGYRLMAEWQPRMVFGVVSLFTLTALVVLWYNLPVQGWHRALLMGFSAYLLVFTVVLNVLRTRGWQTLEWLGLLDGVAYLALTIWWAFASWAPDTVGVEIPATVRRKLGLETA